MPATGRGRALGSRWPTRDGLTRQHAFGNSEQALSAVLTDYALGPLGPMFHGTVTGTVTASATQHGVKGTNGTLAGSATATAAQSGHLGHNGTLAGSAEASATTTGHPAHNGTCSGSATATATCHGTSDQQQTPQPTGGVFYARKDFHGRLKAVATTTAAIRGTRGESLHGTATGSATTTAAMRGTFGHTGRIHLVTTVHGKATGTHDARARIACRVTATASASGVVRRGSDDDELLLLLLAAS